MQFKIVGVVQHIHNKHKHISISFPYIDYYYYNTFSPIAKPKSRKKQCLNEKYKMIFLIYTNLINVTIGGSQKLVSRNKFSTIFVLSVFSKYKWIDFTFKWHNISDTWSIRCWRRWLSDVVCGRKLNWLTAACAIIKPIANWHHRINANACIMVDCALANYIISSRSVKFWQRTKL